MPRLTKLITLRKWYRTREGDPVKLWCLDPHTNRPFPVKGHILTRNQHNRKEILNGTWTRIGWWPRNDNIKHPRDLIEIRQEEWELLTVKLGIKP